MNRGDILTKAVAVAKRNGFDISDDFFTDIPVETWLQENQDLYYSIIFCHDFAISFFGENLISIDGYSKNVTDINLADYELPMVLMMSNRKNISIIAWQYHLIQMTLCKDPLIYLDEFINDKINSNSSDY